MAVAHAPAAALPTDPPAAREAAARSRVGPGNGWLVSPRFDLLLVANLHWPLLLLVQWAGGAAAEDGVRFWQVYFVTTPHRWITLALVFLDRDRFRERPVAFPLVAAAAVGACGGVWLATGSLTCLLAVDYVWNAWHFAAQHHGVYRIYGRRAAPARTSGLSAEKWLIRAFVVYVAVRVAGWSWSYPTIDGWLMRADYAAAAIPVFLFVSEAASGRRAAAPGRLAYLASFCTLYLALLWAVHACRPGLVLDLATASALFHATEYLAVVTWSVRGRRAETSTTLWTRVVGEWGLCLAAFVLVLGLGGWLIDTTWMKAWLLLNVAVAFMHYAYDGLIWKARPRGAAA